MSVLTHRKWPLIFFLLSLIANLSSIAVFYHIPYFDSLSKEYFDRAENILDGKGDIEYYTYQGRLYSQPAIFRPPGYSFLIAGFQFVFGRNILIFTIFQIILLSSFSPVYYKIITDIFSNPRISKLSTFLMICFLPFYRLAVFREPVVFVGPLLLVGIYLIYKQKYFLSGVVIGLSVLFREDAILMLPLLFLTLLLFPFFFEEKISLSRRFRKSVVFLSLFFIGFVLIVTPWLIRNYVSFHKFPYFCTPKAGTVLIQGIAEYDVDNRFHLEYSDNDLVKSEGYESWFPNADERNRARLEKAKNIILENPIWYLKVMVKRIPQYTYFIGGGGTTVHFMQTTKSFLYGKATLSVVVKELISSYKSLWFSIFAAIQISIYYLFWLIGLTCLIKTKQKKLWILFLIIPFSYMIHIVHHVEPRYFMPAIYFIIPVSAYGIYCLFIMPKAHKSSSDIL
jgi:4-amino-4-deoxy-L-arabinose transferase-like glycosyltransferase